MACYYAGEICRLNDDLARAQDYFEACVATGAVFDSRTFQDLMSEYDLAQWRLRQLSAGRARQEAQRSRP